MRPYDSAALVYDREPCARTFEEDFCHHLAAGFVISLPDVFAMVRLVSSSWPDDDLLKPWLNACDGDMWHVWLAAGDVGKLFSLLPPKKWVAFERSNQLRRVEYERLRRLWRPGMGS